LIVTDGPDSDKSFRRRPAAGRAAAARAVPVGGGRVEVTTCGAHAVCAIADNNTSFSGRISGISTYNI
jgi:hypothetical protein